MNRKFFFVIGGVMPIIGILSLLLWFIDQGTVIDSHSQKDVEVENSTSTPSSMVEPAQAQFSTKFTGADETLVESVYENLKLGVRFKYPSEWGQIDVLRYEQFGCHYYSGQYMKGKKVHKFFSMGTTCAHSGWGGTTVWEGRAVGELDKGFGCETPWALEISQDVCSFKEYGPQGVHDAEYWFYSINTNKSDYSRMVLSSQFFQGSKDEAERVFDQIVQSLEFF